MIVTPCCFAYSETIFRKKMTELILFMHLQCVLIPEVFDQFSDAGLVEST